MPAVAEHTRGPKRFLAVGIMPALVFAGLAASSAAADAPGSCVLGIFCTPSSPTPSPSASTNSGSGGSAASPKPSPSSSSGSGLSGLLPSLKPSSSGKTGPLGNLIQSVAGKAAASKKNGTKKNSAVKQAGDPSGVTAPSATSVLTAKSSSMTKFNFVGVATLPVGGGGTEKALEFTASSASLSSVGIQVTQDGKSVLTKTASLNLPDGMTLYTTKLCGQVQGILPNICFTPSTASAVALKLASVLGQSTPITMTNVTADQFVNLATTAKWGALNMGTE